MKLRITVEGNTYEVEVEILENGDGPGAVPQHLQRAAPRPQQAASPAPIPQAAAPPAALESGEKVIKSPIAGAVLQVKVKPGDEVTVNQVVLVMEAMKMETNVASPIEGKIKALHVKPGDAVAQDQVLVEFE